MTRKRSLDRYEEESLRELLAEQLHHFSKELAVDPLSTLESFGFLLRAGFGDRPANEETGDQILDHVRSGRLAALGNDAYTTAIHTAVATNLVIRAVVTDRLMDSFITGIRAKSASKRNAAMGARARAAAKREIHQDWIINARMLQERFHWSPRKIAGELAKTAGAPAKTIYSVILPDLRSRS
jgi:hypothetical protein